MKTILHLFLAAVSLAASAKPGRAGYTLNIATAEPVVKVHDDIFITATVTNPSDEPEWIDFGESANDYNIDVRDGTGNFVPESAYRRRLTRSVFTGGRMLPMPPHKTVTASVDITKYFDFPESPGTYAIQLSRHDLRSNVLIITVIPTLAANDLETFPEGTVALQPAASSGAAQKDFSLEIEVDRSMVFSGQTIPVYAFLINKSSRNISIPAPNSLDSEYGIEVRNAEGETMPATRAGRARKNAVAVIGDHKAQFLMLPGLHLSGEVDITRYVDLRPQGTCFVQLRWDVPEALGGGEIRSNVLKLSIRGRAVQPQQPEPGR